MIFILSSPQTRNCGGCGREAAQWHVVSGEGYVSELCDLDLARFLTLWRTKGLKTAGESFRKREVVIDQ
jgi:hypothetical protein